MKKLSSIHFTMIAFTFAGFASIASAQLDISGICPSTGCENEQQQLELMRKMGRGRYSLQFLTEEQRVKLAKQGSIEIGGQSVSATDFDRQSSNALKQIRSNPSVASQFSLEKSETRLPAAEIARTKKASPIRKETPIRTQDDLEEDLDSKIGKAGKIPARPKSILKEKPLRTQDDPEPELALENKDLIKPIAKKEDKTALKVGLSNTDPGPMGSEGGKGIEEVTSIEYFGAPLSPEASSELAATKQAATPANAVGSVVEAQQNINLKVTGEDGTVLEITGCATCVGQEVRNADGTGRTVLSGEGTFQQQQLDASGNPISGTEKQFTGTITTDQEIGTAVRVSPDTSGTGTVGASQPAAITDRGTQTRPTAGRPLEKPEPYADIDTRRQGAKDQKLGAVDREAEEAAIRRRKGESPTNEDVRAAGSGEANKDATQPTPAQANNEQNENGSEPAATTTAGAAQPNLAAADDPATLADEGTPQTVRPNITLPPSEIASGDTLEAPPAQPTPDTPSPLTLDGINARINELESKQRLADISRSENEKSRKEIDDLRKEIANRRNQFGIEDGQEDKAIADSQSQIDSFIDGPEIGKDVAPDVRNRIAELRLENAGNPEGFRKALDEYEKELIEKNDEQYNLISGDIDKLQCASEKECAGTNIKADLAAIEQEKEFIKTREEAAAQADATIATNREQAIVDAEKYVTDNNIDIDAVRTDQDARSAESRRYSVGEYTDKIAAQESSDEVCQIGSSIGFGGCETTETVVKISAVTNQLLSAAGSAGASIVTSQQAENAFKEGTVSGSLKGAAKAAKFTAMTSGVSGAVNTIAGITQGWYGWGHSSDAEALKAAEDKMKGRTGLTTKRGGDMYSSDGKTKGTDGYITAEGTGDKRSVAGITQNTLDVYRLNEERAKKLRVIKKQCQGITDGQKYQECLNIQTVARNQDIRDKEELLYEGVQNVTRRAKKEQEQVAEKATAGAFVSMISGIQNLATAAFTYQYAKDLEKSARNLAKTGAEPDFDFDPLDDGQVDSPRTGSVTPASGQVDNAALADGGDGFAAGDNPLDTGPGTTPNLNGNTVPNSGLEIGKEAPRTAGGGGDSGGSGGVQSASTNPATGGGGEPGEPVYADPNGQGLSYGSAGATASRGGAGGGSSSGGLGGLAGIANDLLKNFLPGKEEQGTSKGILEFANRSVAGANTSNLLGKSANLFKRISQRYEKKAVQGAI